MRVFGCAWKINFPEIIFNWPGVLKALTRKWFEVKIFTSNHFRTHAQRQRERERERERAFDFGFADHSLRLRLWLRRLRRSQPSNSTSPIYEPTNLRTDHAFDFADHAFNFVDLRTHEPIFDPEPRTHKPISLSLCDFDFLCDFDRPTSLWSLIFLLLLWWCFGGFPVVWWWVLCGWWWKIAFSECYQTHENIF